MASESDQIPLVAVNATPNDTKTASGEESDIAMASSSSTRAVEKMVKKEVPVLMNYWKKSMVTKVDRVAYHANDWLPDGVESSVPDWEFPTVDNSLVVCFESHLVAGLGLPPSKFLVSILNFLRCELVHLNPNAITALNYFTMLCECWLRIAPDISLFMYFYSPARCEKTIFSGIGMSLCHHHWKEYLDATFKGSWKGDSWKWFLVDMHVLPQWMNKHLLPPQIEDKWGEPEMTPCLAALVKWVTDSVNPVFEHVIVPKNLLFGGFTLSTVGRSWCMNVCGLLIQVVSHLIVRSEHSLLLMLI
jgi:hypothetical protein